MKENMESGTNPREHHPMEDYLFLTFCVASLMQLLMFFNIGSDMLLTLLMIFGAINTLMPYECDLDELVTLSLMPLNV